MATYYVDGVNGSDSYDGTVPDYTSGTTGPWATIAKILSSLSSSGGDTVWVAPGTYRQSSALTSSVSYSAKSYIKGDPDCSQAWDATVEPGIVRITATDANDQPYARDLFNLTAVNNLEIWDAQLDGASYASGYHLFENSTLQADTKLVRCVLIGGNYGAYKVNCDECVAIFQNAQSFMGSATSWPTCKRCFGMGRGSAIFQDCYADQCFGIAIAQGSSSAFYTTIAAGSVPAGFFKNCFAIGYYCYRAQNNQTSGGPGVVNCFSHGYFFSRGFQAGCDPANCFIHSTWYDIPSGDACDLSSCRGANINTSNASVAATAAHNFDLPPALSILRALPQAFGWERFGDEDMADNANATSETYGLNRRLMATRFRGQSATRKYCFPWGLTDRGLSYDATKKNIVTLYKVSSEAIRIPIKKATATTISVQCDWDLDSGSTYPQIDLVRENAGGDPTSLGTDTIVGGDSQGHTLSIALTTGSVTDKDIVATLILKARETAANSYASFYGLTVS